MPDCECDCSLFKLSARRVLTAKPALQLGCQPGHFGGMRLGIAGTAIGIVPRRFGLPLALDHEDATLRSAVAAALDPRLPFAGALIEGRLPAIRLPLAAFELRFELGQALVVSVALRLARFVFFLQPLVFALQL